MLDYNKNATLNFNFILIFFININLIILKKFKLKSIVSDLKQIILKHLFQIYICF